MKSFFEWMLSENTSGLIAILQEMLQSLGQQNLVYGFNYRDFNQLLQKAQQENALLSRTGVVREAGILDSIETAMNNNPASLPQVIKQTIVKLQSQPAPKSAFNDEDE